MEKVVILLSVLGAVWLRAVAYPEGEEAKVEEVLVDDANPTEEAREEVPQKRGTLDGNYGDQVRGQSSEYGSVNGDQFWQKEQSKHRHDGNHHTDRYRQQQEIHYAQQYNQQQQNHHEHQDHHDKQYNHEQIDPHQAEQYSSHHQSEPHHHDHFDPHSQHQDEHIYSSHFNQHHHHHHDDPKILEHKQTEHIKTVTFTKKIPKPYSLHLQKKVPYEVKVPVDRPVPVYVPQPYPVYIEKKVPFEVKVPVPQPFSHEKKVPYEINVPMEKPYPIAIEKPYPLYIEKKIPYFLEKPVPYPVKVPLEKPYPIPVPVEKGVPYTVEQVVHYPVRVESPVPYQVEKQRPPTYSVEKPDAYDGEKKVPYSEVKVENQFQAKVPYEESSTVQTPIENGKDSFVFPDAQGQRDEGQGQENGGFAPIAEMQDAGPQQQQFSKESSGSGQGNFGGQENYGTDEQYKSSGQQDEEEKKVAIDPKRAVGRSYSHNSMQTSGKKISYSTTIDHY